MTQPEAEELKEPIEPKVERLLAQLRSTKPVNSQEIIEVISRLWNAVQYAMQTRAPSEIETVGDKPSYADLANFASRVSEMVWGGELGWEKPSALANLFSVLKREWKAHPTPTQVVKGAEPIATNFATQIQVQRIINQRDKQPAPLESPVENEDVLVYGHSNEDGHYTRTWYFGHEGMMQMDDTFEEKGRATLSRKPVENEGLDVSSLTGETALKQIREMIACFKSGGMAWGTALSYQSLCVIEDALEKRKPFVGMKEERAVSKPLDLSGLKLTNPSDPRDHTWNNAIEAAQNHINATRTEGE